MEKQFNEKENLDLISQMINSAKNNLQRGNGNVFLLWGYLVAAVSLINLVLMIMLPDRIIYYSYIIWYVMPLGLFMHYYLLKKIDKKTMVITYVDKIMGYVWVSFTISVIVLMISMSLGTIVNIVRDVQDTPQFIRWIHWHMMTPFMLILYGFALFISGKAYRFKPLVRGAFVCWVFTAAIFFFYGSDYFSELQLAALCISVVAGFIIPGHLLNKKERSHVPGT